MRVSTKASLSDIASALSGHAPSRQRPQVVTWGSVVEDADYIGRYDGVPDHIGIEVAAPEVRLMPEDALPEHAASGASDRPVHTSPKSVDITASVSARCYWFTRTAIAERILAPGTPTAWRLNAADIVLSEMDGTADLRLLVTSWNDNDIRFTIVPALEAVLTGIDSATTISTVSSDLDLATGDVYLWLLDRMIEEAPVSTSLRMDSIDRISVRDPLGATSTMSNGLHSARLDLRANLADDGKTYGPAHLSVYSSMLQAAFVFQLSLNGAFQVDLNASQYYDDEVRTKLETRRRQVADMTHVIIPELQAAFRGDRTWTDRKEAFRQSNRDAAMGALRRL